MTKRYVCIHGHFYQPPRENAWLERIEQQDTAYPFHDWNERINHECYEPNTASRILEGYNNIVDIVNNYSNISFNFGPTLLSWLQEHALNVYKAILRADERSMNKYKGHGCALAQAYNHMIMPLACKRDKHTQVIWGIKDFEYRFKRKPEGMWLPETAVDYETLDILAEHGIKFTILAPGQAKKFRKKGELNWQSTENNGIDPKRAYECHLPSGNTIAIFFYDGPVSNEIAFKGLLKDGKVFADRLLGLFDKNDKAPQLVHIATDGESYGHHHRHGDMALSFCNHYIEKESDAKLTIYGAYLEMFPVECEVIIHENSSWSCAHGVERWRSDCGCKTSSDPNIKQTWRKPLRESLDWLRDTLYGIYEEKMKEFTSNPREARNGYINIILDRSEEAGNTFYQQYISKTLSQQEKITVNKLLEMQRQAMLMYTSCGWFFNDIGGIETIQIMQYAARAIQLAYEVSGNNLESLFLEKLEKAKSNYTSYKDGKHIYNTYIRPSIVDLERVAAHYAISSLFFTYPEHLSISDFIAKSRIYQKVEAGNQRLATGQTLIKSIITLEEKILNFAVIYLGDHNILGGVKERKGKDHFHEVQDEFKNSFMKNDIPQLIHLLDKHFGTHNYSFWHLFKDEQRNIIDQILERKLESIGNSYRRIFQDSFSLLQVMKNFEMSFPNALSAPAEFVLNKDLMEQLDQEDLNVEEIKRIIEKINWFSFHINSKKLEKFLSDKIQALMEDLYHHPQNVRLIYNLNTLFEIIERLSLRVDLWKGQNAYFRIGKRMYPKLKEKLKNNDKEAERWMKAFGLLGQYFNVTISA